MTVRSFPPSLTLGVALTRQGFSWIAFDGPLHIYNWNSPSPRDDKNRKCVREFERLIDRLQPELIVLEDLTLETFRSKRVLQLHQLFLASAREHHIDIVCYRREHVRSCFSTVGATTHQEIAEAIARQFPDLSHRIPRKRRSWECSGRRLGLFCAAALVLTHFHWSGSDFTDTLKSGSHG
jgi:hypothetical protein